MVKQLMQRTELDKQVERYLRDPLTLNEIRNYSLHRDYTGMMTMTLEIYVNPTRFDEARGE